MHDSTPTTCPACGAIWRDGLTCDEAFYQMLAWENEQPELGVVHHLMVLCFMLQHPERYSPDGLHYSTDLLAAFVEGGLTPQQARQRNSAAMSSHRRGWKVTARPGDAAAYPRLPRWTMYASDIVAGEQAGYIENVNEWARSVLAAIRAAG